MSISMSYPPRFYSLQFVELVDYERMEISWDMRNRDEGSIPFTRSIDNKGLRASCCKTAVNPGFDNLPPTCHQEASRYINPHRLFHGVWIPQWLEERSEISEKAKKLYAYLTYFAGGRDVLGRRSGSWGRNYIALVGT